MKRLNLIVIFAFILSCNTTTEAAGLLAIDTVPVGNIGNIGDVQPQGTFGAVDYHYRIGTTEVTNSQYAEFLNAVAATDTHQLFSFGMSNDTRGGIMRSGSLGNYIYTVKADAVGQGPNGIDYTFGNKPVVFVTFWDAVRFTNWLHNGQKSGDQDNTTTEDGAYTLGGVRYPTNNTISRNVDAKWFIPTEDEWFKAAYHKNDGDTGNYFNYATSSNNTPDNNLPLSDTGNSANFFNGEFTTGDSDYPLTGAGAYTESGSPYGTFDQSGNVYEWNETIVTSFFRGQRSGAWSDLFSPFHLTSDASGGNDWPFKDDNYVGFRVATVPEPNAFLLFGFGTLMMLCLRRKFAK